MGFISITKGNGALLLHRDGRWVEIGMGRELGAAQGQLDCAAAPCGLEAVGGELGASHSGAPGCIWDACRAWRCLHGTMEGRAAGSDKPSPPGFLYSRRDRELSRKAAGCGGG